MGDREDREDRVWDDYWQLIVTAPFDKLSLSPRWVRPVLREVPGVPGLVPSLLAGLSRKQLRALPSGPVTLTSALSAPLGDSPPIVRVLVQPADGSRDDLDLGDEDVPVAEVLLTVADLLPGLAGWAAIPGWDLPDDVDVDAASTMFGLLVVPDDVAPPADGVLRPEAGARWLGELPTEAAAVAAVHHLPDHVLRAFDDWPALGLHNFSDVQQLGTVSGALVAAHRVRAPVDVLVRAWVWLQICARLHDREAPASAAKLREAIWSLGRHHLWRRCRDTLDALVRGLREEQLELPVDAEDRLVALVRDIGTGLLGNDPTFPVDDDGEPRFEVDVWDESALLDAAAAVARLIADSGWEDRLADGVVASALTGSVADTNVIFGSDSWRVALLAAADDLPLTMAMATGLLAQPSWPWHVLAISRWLQHLPEDLFPTPDDDPQVRTATEMLRAGEPFADVAAATGRLAALRAAGVALALLAGQARTDGRARATLERCPLLEWQPRQDQSHEEPDEDEAPTGASRLDLDVLRASRPTGTQLEEIRRATPSGSVRDAACAELRGLLHRQLGLDSGEPVPPSTDLDISPLQMFGVMATLLDAWLGDPHPRLTDPEEPAVILERFVDPNAPVVTAAALDMHRLARERLLLVSCTHVLIAYDIFPALQAGTAMIAATVACWSRQAQRSTDFLIADEVR